jgi:hypothetical protein
VLIPLGRVQSASSSPKEVILPAPYSLQAARTVSFAQSVGRNRFVPCKSQHQLTKVTAKRLNDVMNCIGLVLDGDQYVGDIGRYSRPTQIISVHKRNFRSVGDGLKPKTEPKSFLVLV